MARVAVKGDMFRWARERSAKSLDNLKARFPALTEWEAEDRQPTMRQLEDFARATYVPLGFMFLPNAPVEPLSIPDFRTTTDEGVRRPSANLIDTVEALRSRQVWLREFLIEEGHERLPFVGSHSIGSDPVVVAADMRATLGVVGSWAATVLRWNDAFKQLVARADRAGVNVVVNGVVANNTRRKLDADEFRGFALVDQFAPFVFVNGVDGKAAQIFTLAHELAHLWVGQTGVSDLPKLQPSSNDVEIACNKIAAEFLVPAADLRIVWRQYAEDLEPFQSLARRFKVSAIVAARRALDVGLIDRDAFFEFYEAYRADERRKKQEAEGGGDFYAVQAYRLGPRFARAVAQGIRDGRLLYRDGYNLTGMNGRTFDRFISEI